MEDCDRRMLSDALKVEQAPRGLNQYEWVHWYSDGNNI